VFTIQDPELPRSRDGAMGSAFGRFGHSNRRHLWQESSVLCGHSVHKNYQ
jgi:hypothetical protein